VLKDLNIESISSWDELKSEVKDKIVSPDLKLIPGFELLSKAKQEEYIEEVARLIWNNNYSVVSSLNWLVGREIPFDPIEAKINQDILDVVAKKLLEEHKYISEEGSSRDYVSLLTWEEKNTFLEDIKQWLLRSGHTTAVPDSSSYNEDIELVFSNIEHAAIYNEKETLRRNMEGFDFGVGILDKYFKGGLSEVVDVDEDVEVVCLTMGLGHDEAEDFKVAYKMFLSDVEDLMSQGDAFGRIPIAFKEFKEVSSMQDLLLEFGGGSKADIDKEITKTIVNNYMAAREDRDSLREEFQTSLRVMFSEAAMISGAKLKQKVSVDRALSLISERFYPDAPVIEFSSLSKEKQEYLLAEIPKLYRSIEGAEGYEVLDEEVKLHLLSECSNAIFMNSETQDLDKDNMIGINMLFAKFEMLEKQVFSNGDVSISNKSDIETILSKGAKELISGDIRSLVGEYWDDVYNELFLESNESFKGFGLLPEPEKVKLSLKWLELKACSEEEQMHFKESIRSKIYQEVEGALKTYRVIEKGVEIVPYEVLDLGVDTISDDEPKYFQGFKELTIQHFLSKCYIKGDSLDGAMHKLLNDDNGVKDTLERTSKRFFTFFLTTEFDEKLYNLIDKLARGQEILESDYITSTGELDDIQKLANELLKKSVAQLKPGFDAEESKYLRKALEEGATLESLLKRPSESITSSRERLMGVLSSGFGVEMFSENISHSLYTSVDEFLLRDRVRAIEFLLTKSRSYTQEVWPKESMFWLDKPDIELLNKSYIELVLCNEPPKLEDWKREWQARIKISHENKEREHLSVFKDSLDGMDISASEREEWIAKAKSELLANMRANLPINLNQTRREIEVFNRQREEADRLERERVERERTESEREDKTGLESEALGSLSGEGTRNESGVSESVGDSGASMLDTTRAVGVPASRVGFMEKIKAYDGSILDAETKRKMTGLADGGVELNRSGLIQGAAKKATMKMALEHYYDVMFQVALGFTEINRGSISSSDNLARPIRELMQSLNISSVEELYRIADNPEEYNTKRRLYVDFQPSDIMLEMGDSKIHTRIKNKILELQALNRESRQKLSDPISSKERKAIREDIKQQELKLSELYIELHYEKQRCLFEKTRESFNEHLVEPASKTVSNRHVLAFLSSVSQALSATKSIDFVKNAADVFQRLQPGYSKRGDTKGIIDGTIDAVLEDEIPKIIYQMYNEQAKPYMYQLQDSIEALRSLEPSDLELREHRDNKAVSGTYEAVSDGIFALLSSFASGEMRYDTDSILNLTARANKTYVNQAIENTERLIQGLEMLTISDVAEKQKLDEIIASLKKDISEIMSLRDSREKHDGTIRDARGDEQVSINMMSLNTQVELADKMLDYNKNLRELAATSHNIDVQGISTVYTAVLDGLSDFRNKVSLTEAIYQKLYLQKASAPDIRLVDVTEVAPAPSTKSKYLDTGNIKEALIVGVESAVSDASMKYKIATNKRLLDSYVKDIAISGKTHEFKSTSNRYNLSPLRYNKKHSILRGLFTFAQKVCYLFKYYKWPTTNEIRGHQAKKLTSVFHNEYQKQQLKSKAGILMNTSRLLSSFNDGEGKATKRYVDNVTGFFTDESKLYARARVDEDGSVLKKHFPQLERHSKDKDETPDDILQNQKVLETRLEDLDEEAYERYIKELNGKIPKKYSEDEDFASTFSEVEFEALKKFYLQYKGSSISPKTNVDLFEKLQAAILEKESLEAGWNSKPKTVSINKEEYHNELNRLSSSIDSLCGQMANNKISDFTNAMENAFNRDIYNIESERLKDSRVLHDPRQAGVVAVKQLFEYDLTNNIVNTALYSGNKLLSSSSDGSISVGGEVGAIVSLYAKSSDTDEFKKWASDITGSMINSGLEQPMTYVKSLSEKYESSPPSLVVAGSSIPTMDTITSQYRERLNTLDVESRGLREELYEADGPGRDWLVSVTQRLKEMGVYIETSFDSIISKLQRGAADPAAMQQGAFARIFATIQNTFADQTMMIADAVENIFESFTPDEWLDSRNDLLMSIKGLNKELSDLKSARSRLAKLWSDKKSEMTKEEEEELLDRIQRLDELRTKVGADISSRIQELCYSAPEGVNEKILESLCLVRWADCYVDFYRVTLDKVELAVDELCMQRKALDDTSQSSLPDSILEVYNAGKNSVISELGKMVATGLNSAPLNQLAAHMVRMEKPEPELRAVSGSEPRLGSLVVTPTPKPTSGVSHTAPRKSSPGA
jgi:hypothetical protein